MPKSGGKLLSCRTKLRSEEMKVRMTIFACQQKTNELEPKFGIRWLNSEVWSALLPVQRSSFDSLKNFAAGFEDGEKLSKILFMHLLNSSLEPFSSYK